MARPTKSKEKEPIHVNAEDYMNNRVNGQLEYYTRKSGYNEKRFKRYKGVTIVCAVLIPFVSGVSWEYSQFAAGLLGIVIAISEGILGLNKYEETWIEYRMTKEMLKQEKLLFQTRTSHYDIEDDEDAFHTFVERVENILAKETAAWKGMMTQEKNKNEQNVIT